MIKNWAAYLFWLIFILILNVFLYSTISLALLIMSVALPLISIIIRRAVPLKVDVKADFPHQCSKEETLTGNIEVINKGLLNVSSADITLFYFNLLTGEKGAMNLSARLPLKSKLSFKGELKSNLCGVVRFSGCEVKGYDLFSLTRKTKRFKLKDEVTVLPEIYPVQLIMSASSLYDRDNFEYSTEKAGEDLSEPFDFREYEEGDSPKSIHWKLSHKYDRLIVQRGSYPIDRSVLLVIGGKEDNGSYQGFALKSTLAEAVISVSQSLCEEKIKHGIVLPDLMEGKGELEAEPAVYEINSEEDLNGIIKKILSVNLSNDITYRNTQINKNNIFSSARFYSELSVKKLVFSLNDERNDSSNDLNSTNTTKIIVVETVEKVFDKGENEGVIYISAQTPSADLAILEI